MKLRYLALAITAAFALTTPAYAAGYIPLGPKIYTPQPDIITPQPDLVTPQPDLVTPQPPIVTPQDPIITENTVLVHSGNTGAAPFGSAADRGFWNEKCQTFAYVNDDCTVLSIADHDKQNNVYRTDVIVTPQPDIVTPQPDIVTPQPDIVTPQPPIVTPQPDSCKQKGIGNHGIGYYSC